MPVTLSYFTVDPLSTQFTLHATNQALSQDLACIPDAALSTMSASCPSGATTSTVAAAYTSATSQLNTGDGFMYQYAVDASQTEVVLTNEDFTTTYQTTSGFLSGQSLIAKITAIQIMQDQINGNPTVLAVFGLGSDGITPYVGYVTGMPLLAYPTTPLTGFAWTTPQPLRQALVGCP
ncbi:hypothetical protein RvY_01339 [Ramazzottius varieornatus]|uniref:Uncharacterized protein n=1 Tax=Ramazzottius varieornatus TaxID=947166 RepID=A0A1D1UFZ7_RAMVA|nr:hypothetical protein RvY_01339 [Ramazzottius varieornatus]